MRRLTNPPLSSSEETTLALYRQVLWGQEDLKGASQHNSLSDLGHFAAWYEANASRSTNEAASSQYADKAKLTDVNPHDLRHHFGYCMARSVPLHRLARIRGHDSLDTTRLYIQGTKHDLQQSVETIAWM